MVDGLALGDDGGDGAEDAEGEGPGHRVIAVDDGDHAPQKLVNTRHLRAGE